MENNILDEIEKQVADENLNGERPVAKPKFKVYREVSGKTDTFEIGDRIKIKINKEKHFATAIQQKGDMTLFILDDCLDEAKSMECEGDLCYEGSDIRKFLKDCKVSKKYRDYLVSAKDWYGTELPWNPWLEDKLFLLSIEEVCGLNSDHNKQLSWFKNNWKNKISTRNNKPEHWWLRNVHLTTEFCLVHINGVVFEAYASSPWFGVRPAFVLRTEGSHEQ